jgi:hypothetical protein
MALDGVRVEASFGGLQFEASVWQKLAKIKVDDRMMIKTRQIPIAFEKKI